ncbi:MAG TPA: 2-hydroxychromene-2-carboxylate isomerase [Sandaracinaceae bacterium LLY-WYZ-13_1]|nr:2-hydroxychromene-2-carboxylate isomerase [Sandaracinaceae bacterium LLY-WYZ-13_1]
MKTVDCYFDYSSPFAYLGTTQVERVAREAGGRVRWKPFLLGALFKRVGTPIVPIQTFPTAKRRHQSLDLYRWADVWGVPFAWPSGFPLRTVDALRLTLLAPAAGRSALIHRIMRAAWVDDEDVADRAVLARCAVDADLDPALVERVGDPETKARLRAATDEALEAGCPGAPCFVVDGHLYWGQDRLDFVRRALSGRPPAPEADAG